MLCAESARGEQAEQSVDMPLIDDQLWASIESFLPPAKPRRFRHPGRKPLPDRIVLAGILFVLRTGIRWNQLPTEMGCGSGVSCWRRLREWQRAGVWDRLHEALLAHVSIAERIDFSRVACGAFSARAARSL